MIVSFYLAPGLLKAVVDVSEDIDTVVDDVGLGEDVVLNWFRY